MQFYPKVAIIYLSFHSDPHLGDAVAAWRKLTYPKDRLEIIVVDNPHPEFGSSTRAIEDMVNRCKEELPRVTILPQTENLGFAGGNNAGARLALSLGCDFLYFHNDDGYLAPGAIEPLVDAMTKDQSIAIAQSLIVLHPNTELINSAGNAFHYLGFGYCDRYRTRTNALRVPAVADVGYASGAGMMARAEAVLNKCWDDDFFMYHEDMEISLRMRLRGARVVLARDSVFYHKYQFNRSIKKFYWMERNRFAVLLLFFKWRTLALLFPILLAVECGLLAMSVVRGSLRERLEVYGYWLRPRHLALWLAKRRALQGERTVTDAFLLKFSVPTIIFQEESMRNPILLYVVNPIMRVYWLFVRFIVRW